MLAALDERPILSVSDLTRQARLLIEERFNLVWVEGEISNFRRPASGHWYFTLKDDQAQVRCAMFAGRNRHIRPQPDEGAQVIVRGRVSLYEPRGDFQIIAEHMEPAGEGALRAAFEALKTRLDAEGLFALERKRPLPRVPTHLAIVSSRSGAAVHDVLHVLERRFPALAVTFVPTRVQGEGADAEVIRALARAAKLGPDVLLLTRGGGSLEDLWTFNTESVARAVAASPIPTVVAVGHQTDFCIAEFAADLRAPTPSAAAELIAPDGVELGHRVGALRTRILRALLAAHQLYGETVQRLRAQLQDPQERLRRQAQRTDELDERVRLAMQNRLRQAHAAATGLARALSAHRPEPIIDRCGLRARAAHERLGRALANTMDGHAHQLAAAARTLDAVSPLNTIGRGYAVLSQGAGDWITSVAQVDADTQITAHLSDGSLSLHVDNKSADNGLPRTPELDNA